MAAVLTLDDVAKLSFDERMRLIELIWASMSAEDVPTRQWHRDVVKERVRLFREDPTQGTDAFEFLDKLGSGE